MIRFHLQAFRRVRLGNTPLKEHNDIQWMDAESSSVFFLAMAVGTPLLLFA
jgi:hypothetical protein